jgi:hypothetical protein
MLPCLEVTKARGSDPNPASENDLFLSDHPSQHGIASLVLLWPHPPPCVCVAKERSHTLRTYTLTITKY